ncbi:MAG: hypothetical protein BWY71_02174 [Planctomycetes bacterium ADurb.Bin412]|nr:MAG: hypothetical protein BWY71_02174 [Planctomycetes bacterium ADurb.Bin412]
MFLGLQDDRQLVLGIRREKLLVIEAVEHLADDLILFQHHGHRLFLIECGRAFAAALGIDRQGRLQIGGNPDIIHNQAAGLIPEYPVHPCNRLHQVMPPHRLIHIHRMQARHIKARQPHIADNHDLQPVIRVFEPFGNLLTVLLGGAVHLPVFRIAGRGSHHHLDRSLFPVRMVPVGPQAGNLPVHLHGNPPAHAYDHRLACKGLLPLLEMLDHIRRHHRHPLRMPDNRLQLRPLGLGLLRGGAFLALGNRRHLLIQLFLLIRLQMHLGQPGFIINPDRGLIVNRLLNIVNVDVMAEHRRGRGVLLLDGCGRKADKRGFRQGIPQILGHSVGSPHPAVFILHHPGLKAVMAAVGLVGNHNNILSL